MKTPKKEPEIIRIHKGRSVGKSTELGAEHLEVQERAQERSAPLSFSLGEKLKEKLAGK